jgi:hypothetical protein
LPPGGWPGPPPGGIPGRGIGGPAGRSSGFDSSLGCGFNSGFRSGLPSASAWPVLSATVSSLAAEFDSLDAVAVAFLFHMLPLILATAVSAAANSQR